MQLHRKRSESLELYLDMDTANTVFALYNDNQSDLRRFVELRDCSRDLFVQITLKSHNDRNSGVFVACP